MTDAAHATEDNDFVGLYVTDCEIIRRLGYGEKRGYRILHVLDRGIPGFRSYPQKDKLFAGRRFWPDVLQWHMDYHRVRRPSEAGVTTQPRWEENFDVPPSRKARQSSNARPSMARA